jgi:pyrimidine-nucleoside phosphorylase
MVRLAGLATDDAAAEAQVRAALRSGAGLEKFRRIIERQGGDPRAIDDYSRLPTAPCLAPVKAPRDGFVAGIDAEKVGVAVRMLGGGRDRAEDGIDHAVGVTVRAKPGESVKAGDVVLHVWHREYERLAAAWPLLEASVTVADAPPAETPQILEEIA